MRNKEGRAESGTEGEGEDRGGRESGTRQRNE